MTIQQVFINDWKIVTSTTWLFLVIVGVISSAFGSFITMLVYRLPRMLKRHNQEKFNLFFPPSHCPQCQTPLKWRHNLPIISYLLLRGQCGFCRRKISARYFVIELVVVVGSVIIAYCFNVSWVTPIMLVFYWIIIANIALALQKH
jgi:prepilin signal peptidase PulO-like enzyme (type II secretory pathway)